MAPKPSILPVDIVVAFYDADILHARPLVSNLFGAPFTFKSLMRVTVSPSANFIPVGIDSNKTLFYICNFSRIPTHKHTLANQ